MESITKRQEEIRDKMIAIVRYANSLFREYGVGDYHISVLAAVKHGDAWDCEHIGCCSESKRLLECTLAAMNDGGTIEDINYLVKGQ